MWDRVALAHKDVLSPHQKGLPHESFRERAYRLCYTSVVRRRRTVLLWSGLQINFVPINFAQQGDGVYTNEASGCAARNSGHSPFTTRGLGAPHSMQRVYTALSGARNSQPLRLGSSALRCATLQSSSAAAQRSPATARPTAGSFVVSGVRACVRACVRCKLCCASGVGRTVSQ